MNIFRKIALSLFLAAFVFGPGAISVLAQSTTPTPAPTQSRTSFSENLARMTIEAARLLPYYIYEVESPLLGWFIKLAQLLAVAITMTAFLRVLRQHEGGSFDLAWWFARVAVCVALITMTTSVINFSTQMGNAVAVGSGEGNSWLNTVRRAQQQSFNESYAKFQAGTFTVRVHSSDLPVNPNPDPSNTAYGILGVLYDKEAKLIDIESRLDVSSWSMSTLFSLLSFCRGLMEFADFFLLIIRSFLLIGVRLFAPFMVAIAIDREFAKQSAYKFAWGVAILTFVFPSVVQIVRIMAYGAGNIALMLGDKEPLYIWDKATMTAVANPTANPVFVIVVMAIIMGIAGIAMLFTPLLSYKLAMGELYQGVSNIVSGISGAGIATAIGTQSAQAGNAINQQARTTEIQGQADASTVTAQARHQSALSSAKGNEVAGMAAARGAMVQSLAGIEGARQAGLISAGARGEFGRNQVAAGVNQNIRDTQTRTEQNTTMIGAQNTRENKLADTEAAGAKRDAIKGSFGGIPLVGPIVGEGVVGTSSWIGDGKGDPRTVRLRGATEASNTYAGTARGAEQTASQKLIGSQQQYGSDMTTAYNQQEAGEKRAVNTQASIAAGGAVRGAQITMGGVQSKYGYDVKAANIELQGQVGSPTQKGAIQIMRDAGVEATKLQRWGADVSSAGSIIANQASSLFRELRF